MADKEVVLMFTRTQNNSISSQFLFIYHCALYNDSEENLAAFCYQTQKKTSKSLNGRAFLATENIWVRNPSLDYLFVS